MASREEISRRSLFQRAAAGAVAAPTALLVAAEDAFAVLGDASPFDVLPGYIVARPSADSIEIDVPGFHRFVAEVAPSTVIVGDNDRPGGSLDDYAVGDSVAVEFPSIQARGEGTNSGDMSPVVSVRITPAVLGEASDLAAVRA